MKNFEWLCFESSITAPPLLIGKFLSQVQFQALNFTSLFYLVSASNLWILWCFFPFWVRSLFSARMVSDHLLVSHLTIFSKWVFAFAVFWLNLSTTFWLPCVRFFVLYLYFSLFIFVWVLYATGCCYTIEVLLSARLCIIHEYAFFIQLLNRYFLLWIG